MQPASSHVLSFQTINCVPCQVKKTVAEYSSSLHSDTELRFIFIRYNDEYKKFPGSVYKGQARKFHEEGLGIIIFDNGEKRYEGQ